MPFVYHSRKYKVNESFFSWSATAAYVLGFWFADGHMRHEKSYRIIFSSKDWAHLYQIRKIIDSNHKIKPFYSRKSKFPCFKLCIHSKLMYRNLYSLGGRPANSSTMQFPDIPKKFMADFIRGYFDGDGSVHFIRYKHTKNGKFYTNIRSNFTCGSKLFLEKIRDHLTKELRVYKRKLCADGNPPTRWKLGYGEKDTYKLLKYLYYPAHKISLQRKAAYLKEFSKTRPAP